MAISDEITRLQQAKADLKTAIENKGVTVPSSTKLNGYADLVDSIQVGGGSSNDYEYKNFMLMNNGDVFEAPLMQKNCLIRVMNSALFESQSFVCRNSSTSKSFSYTLDGAKAGYFLCTKASNSVTVLKTETYISIK